MEILKQGTRAVQLLQDIPKLLDELRALNSPQAILDALVAYQANPNAQGPVADAIARLNLNAQQIQSFIANNRTALTFLLGNVGAAAKQKLSWPVAVDNTLNVNAVAIELGANASATVAGDDDGDLFDDGAITYEKDSEAFLSFVIDGAVSALGNVPSFPIGVVSGKAAFGANASVTVGNYFKHAVSDSALTALIDDVRAFKLPYDAAHLRDGQVVRLHNTGSIAVSGGLSFGKTVVMTGEVSEKTLGLAAAPITAEAKIAASLDFNAEVNGSFNILLTRDKGTNRVRVRLVQVRESSRGIALKAGVGVTITGIDKVASAVVSQITTPLAPLVKLIENDLTTFGDLHQLFDQQLSATVNHLLNSQSVTTQLQQWLARIGVSVDLKAKLKEALTNAIDARTGALVDDFQHHLNPLLNAVKELVVRYQRALERVNAAVKAAAEVKIGIELAHKRSRFDTRTTALDLSIDPALPAFRKCVHGDFTEALALARQGDAGVTLNDATWSGSGGLRIETSLNISAFGLNAGVGTLLQQDWDYEVTATGDLNLGVRTSIEAWSKSWRALRSVTFLADTRVLAVVTSADKLRDPRVSDHVSLDASIRWTPPPTRTQLSDWEKQMIALGVLAGPTTALTELVVNAASKQPFGDLVASAVLDFSESELETILNQSVDTASEQFVENLTALYLSDSPNPFTIRDRNGLLFLRWKHVRETGLVPGGTTVVFDNANFRADDQKTQVQVGAAQRLPVSNALRVVLAFERMLGQLKSMRQINLSGRAIDDAVQSIAVQQRKLMAEASNILAATPLRREELGRAFFITLWQLAGGLAQVDPFAVIVRKGATPNDDERFVYD
ncbi:MAG: hypothetical protein JO197_24040 [Acidobacteria bacterium]|nr:hypothetical protein [Acidobacteriota bacterium]MBV9474942.1 hypothetical protein [Acidobacteriota bacterium]